MYYVLTYLRYVAAMICAYALCAALFVIVFAIALYFTPLGAPHTAAWILAWMPKAYVYLWTPLSSAMSWFMSFMFLGFPALVVLEQRRTA